MAQKRGPEYGLNPRTAHVTPDSGVSLFADRILQQKMAPLLGPFPKNVLEARCAGMPGKLQQQSHENITHGQAPKSCQGIMWRRAHSRRLFWASCGGGLTRGKSCDMCVTQSDQRDCTDSRSQPLHEKHHIQRLLWGGLWYMFASL